MLTKTAYVYVTEDLLSLGYKPDKSDVIVHHHKHLVKWEREEDGHIIRFGRHGKRDAVVADPDGTTNTFSNCSMWDVLKETLIPALASGRKATPVQPEQRKPGQPKQRGSKTPYAYVTDDLLSLGYKPNPDKQEVIIHHHKHLVKWEREEDGHFIRVGRCGKSNVVVADPDGTLDTISTYGRWDVLKETAVPALVRKQPEQPELVEQRPVKKLCPYGPGDKYKHVDTEDDEPDQAQPDQAPALALAPAEQVFDLTNDDN
jgi:hypothetical protein